MTRTAADSPAWPSSLKLGMNLVASTSIPCHFFPYSSHTGASVRWILSSHWILITLSRDTRHNLDVPSIGWWSWTVFNFPLPKKAEILSQTVIQFTPIRAPHEAVVNITRVDLNNTRISLFVTELYLRNRVSDHHVSASSRPTGLRLLHVDDPVAESASKRFAFALWHKEFHLTISAYLCWHQAARSFHDFTV